MAITPAAVGAASEALVSPSGSLLRRLIRPGGWSLAVMDMDPSCSAYQSIPAPILTLLKSTEPCLDPYFGLDLEQELAGRRLRCGQQPALQSPSPGGGRLAGALKASPRDEPLGTVHPAELPFVLRGVDEIQVHFLDRSRGMPLARSHVSLEAGGRPQRDPIQAATAAANASGCSQGTTFRPGSSRGRAWGSSFG
jgi:hypothetical protein